MVKKFNVFFDPAGEERRIHLYLPDDYDRTCERYPVVYMLDGQNLYFDSDATFGKSLGMKEFLDGWNKKMIVVGIQCSFRDLQRAQEYCPYHIQSTIYGDLDGRGDATIRWIVQELKPFIDRGFRTYGHREATAVAGYSMGGMMALYTVLRYNDYFSKAAVISPALAPAMGHFKDEIQNHTFSADTKIYFSWGSEEDSYDAVRRMGDNILYLEKEIQKKGIQTYIFVQQGGRHNEQSWEHQVPVWMNFLWF